MTKADISGAWWYYSEVTSVHIASPRSQGVVCSSPRACDMRRTCRCFGFWGVADLQPEFHSEIGASSTDSQARMSLKEGTAMKSMFASMAVVLTFCATPPASAEFPKTGEAEYDTYYVDNTVAKIDSEMARGLLLKQFNHPECQRRRPVPRHVCSLPGSLELGGRDKSL